MVVHVHVTHVVPVPGYIVYLYVISHSRFGKRLVCTLVPVIGFFFNYCALLNFDFIVLEVFHRRRHLWFKLLFHWDGTGWCENST